MNIHPHGSSGGDGRRPPRDRNRLGVHEKGALRKSKKRQQRPNQTSQQQSGTAQRAKPVFTAADLASEGESFDVMHDPVILANHMNAAAASAGDTGAQIEAAVAQVLAARAAAQQAAAQQAAAMQAASAQPLTPAASSPSAPGSSSLHASRALASSSDRSIHCPHCSETYTSLRGARRHVRKYHDREGARHCFRCNFVAPDLQTAQLHLCNHTTVRAGASSSRGKIHCPYCTMRYASDEGVRLHVRAVHDSANVHHCSRCRFTAPDPDAIQDHRHTHHDRRHRCPACRRKFTFADISEHMRNCIG